MNQLIATFILFLACLTSHAAPTYAQLNRRFDRNRITEKQSAYLWTLEQVNLIKPELRGTSRETTFLSVRGLRDGGYSLDPQSPEWCVLNRAGRPVKPRAEFLRTESQDAAESQIDLIWRVDQYGKEYFTVRVPQGEWQLWVVYADGWTFPVRTVHGGDYVSQFRDAEFNQDFRLVRIK